MNAQTDRSAHGVRRLVPRSVLGRILALAAVVALIAGVTAAALGVGSTPAAGTVRGVVVYGPRLPIDPGPGISWTTQKSDVFVYRPGASAPLRTLHTGPDGRFAITLAPGRYRLSAQPSGISTMPIAHPVTVTVTAGGTANARILLE
jgi:hypothetical protein